MLALSGALSALATSGSGCTAWVDARLSSLRDGGSPAIDAQPTSDAEPDEDSGPRDSGAPDTGIDAPASPCDGVICEANQHCEPVAGEPACLCDDGFADDGSGSCVDVDECATGALTCDERAICRNEAGSARCVCLPGTRGDGTTCTVARVLVWSDVGDGSDEVARAVTAAGFRVTDTHDDTTFGDELDAGDVDLVIVAGSIIAPLSATTSRLQAWVDGGGKLVLAIWNLDTDPAMRAVAQVEATSFDRPRLVYSDADARPSLFEQQGRVASPIVPIDWYTDDGDELTPTEEASSRVFARFDTALGPSAIVSTRDGQVIINGFIPAGIHADTDGDSLNDFGELIQNEVNFLLRPRVLAYHDDVEAVPALPGAIARLGWTRIDVLSPDAFPFAYSAGGFDVLAVQSSAQLLQDDFQSRVFDWVVSGHPALVSYWDLDGSSGGTAVLRDALQVSAVTRDDPTPIVRDPDAPIDLFRLREAVPDAVTPTDAITDDGDALTPTTADASVVARFGSASGPGAIAATRDGQVIVNGFLPYDFAGRDEDSDTFPDVQELYVNELLYLVAR